MRRSPTTTAPPALDQSSLSPRQAPGLADPVHRIPRANPGALSRIVAQQLAAPPANPEATNDRT